MTTLRKIFHIKFISKTALLLLCFSLIILALITGSYAWNTLVSQINEFTGDAAQEYAVQLIKYEKDTDTPVTIAGTEFYLYLSDGVQIGDKMFVTDENGQINVSGLALGDYYFEEIKPNYGYTYDKDDNNINITRYPFTISKENVNEEKLVLVNAYNIRNQSFLQITKTVQGGEDTEKAFTFTVIFSDSGNYEYSIDGGSKQPLTDNELQLKDGQIATFDNLPIGVQYTVTETPEPDYIISSINHQANIPPEGITAAFVNTYRDAIIPTGTLNISKTVSGSDVDVDKSFNFTVTFSDDGTYKYRIQDVTSGIFDDETTLTSGDTLQLKHNQTAVFKDLPIDLIYTVTEDDYMPDYITAKPNNTTGAIAETGANVLFNNHKVQEVDSSGYLSVTKQVTGRGGEKDRMFNFTVEFEGDDFTIPDTYTYYIGDEAYTFTNGQEISLKHDETAIFVDLPANLTYTVTEEDCSEEGYTTSADNPTGVIQQDEMASVTYINDNPGTLEEDETILIVKKKVEGEIPDQDRDREFSFTVIIDGVETRFMLKDGEQKEFTLPVGAVYEVYEDDYLSEGFAQSSITSGYGTATKTVIESIKTNTYIGTVTIDIEGEKIWDMSADETAVKPESIIVYLKHGDDIVKSAVVKPDSNNKWNFTFTASKYDENGIEIEYVAEEKPVEGYISTVGENNTITNTYVLPARYNPSVQKIITGDMPKDKSNFMFALAAINGSPLPEEGKDEVKTILINGSGDSKFGDITFTKAGTYSYTISEVNGNIDGYTYDKTVYTLVVNVECQDNKLAVENSAYTKAGDSAPYEIATFTNEYKEPNFTSVTVTKVWIGLKSKQPNSIQVKLYKDGVSYGDPMTLSATNNWTYTWEKLSKEAVWTVDETSVPKGYTRTITGDAANGFTIINTLTSSKPAKPDDTTELTTISGMKMWQHGSNPVNSQPQSIKIYIKDGKRTVSEKVVTAKDNWKWSFNLPKYAADKSVIKYTIEEDLIPGYTAKIDGFNITNTHESYDTVNISGQKTWIHRDNAVLPDSIIIYVNNKDKLVVEKKVTAEDNWSWSFNLPKYEADGKTVIQYTINEAPVNGYVKTVEGYNITNEYDPSSPDSSSINVPKTGDKSNIWFWLILILPSSTVLITTFMIKRKQKYNH